MANEFLEELFGTQEGYVYSPVKDPNWNQHFFGWPKELARLEDHISKYNEREVYISPVLFSRRSITPESFKGTYYLWTEFDGSLPQDAIPPTMRIMSSMEGREHWYWKLDHFETNKTQVEDLTKRICHHYGADPSAWDYQQVLRPPDTWNHKRNKPVTLIEKNSNIYSLDKFLWLPIPVAGTNVDVKLSHLPPIAVILAKYKWSIDALDLLFKEVPKGSRSDALVRLAYGAVEAGCSNEEVYVLLDDRDLVWGKFTGRIDRKKRLEDMISHVRSRKALATEIIQGTPQVYRFHDFMRTKITMKWAIKDLLPVAGSLVLFGKGGIGKSTFALRMGISLALGEEKFLIWDILLRQKVLFVSLEMQHGELKSFFEDMNISEDKQQMLQDWFHIWPIGHAYPLDTPDQQLELLKFIDMHKIEVVIIDSLAIAMYGSVKDDDAIKRLNSFLNEDVRKERNCSYVFIHHPRKQGIDENKGKIYEQDDVFGSIYISNNAQSVLYFSGRTGSNKITIKSLKRRLTEEGKDVHIERTPDRGFKLIDHSSPNVETSSDKIPNVGIFGKLSDI